MKLKLTLPVLALAWLAGLNHALAQGTAFTYQGQLASNNIPLTGIYEMSFTLYNASTGGPAVGGPLVNNSVAVTNGLFTVALDFGSSPFTGNPVWLGINVGPNGAPSLTPLVPRQQLTPEPYAIFATTANNLTGALPAVQLSGPVLNTQLANSSVTVNAGTGLSGGGTAPLGGSVTLNNAGVTSLTGSDGVTVSASSGAVTLGLGSTLNLPAEPVQILSGYVSLLYADNNDNFAIGQSAGGYGGSAEFNTAVGFGALASNLTGDQNTASGSYALGENSSGFGNSAYGLLALGHNTSGSGNTAIGLAALNSNTNGSENTSCGDDALASNTSGYGNVASGSSALEYNVTGSYNVADGGGALLNNTNGSQNTASGFQALAENFGGNENTAYGYGVLGSLGQNTGIGGTNNIALGYQAGAAFAANESFNIDIGNGGVAGESRIIRIGVPGVHTATYLAGTVYANGVALTSDRNAKENFTPLDAENVLAKVAALPVTEWNYKSDSAEQKHIGPMAQDFHAAFGLDGSDNKHISVVDEGGVALAAIQGLNQKLDEKDAVIQQQAADIAALQARLEKLEQVMNSRNGGGQ